MAVCPRCGKPDAADNAACARCAHWVGNPAGEPGGVGWWLLTWGQFVSIAACLVVVIRAARAAWGLMESAAPGADRSALGFWPTAWAVAEQVAVFLTGAAMFVVFSRVKQVPYR